MIEPTIYYEEFLRYFKLAEQQQIKCNLGSVPYNLSEVNDDLMENVELYDVVERKYAGFSAIVNDCFYGWTDKHPYWNKMKSGNYTQQRSTVAKDWTGKHSDFKLPEWLYIFLLHRVCGSGINYSYKPSGYHNTILFNLYQCKDIESMVGLLNHYPTSFYTSVGYQFPQFPKVPPNKSYKKGGDYYLSEYAPRLARELAEWLESGTKRDMREIGDFLFAWNTKNELKLYKFQYAAFIADIADWFPQYVNKQSLFYYGSNARECISYLAKSNKPIKQDLFLDNVMEMIYNDTNSVPYNAEDVCCDFIRWVENYIRPGGDYNNLDFDQIFSSCKIKDHPFGRQKAMLNLGLVKTFNTIKAHPANDLIILQSGLTISEYKKLVMEKTY